MNEWIGLILTLSNFVLLYFAYRFFGKVGIFAYIALSVIGANIQVTKTVELLGFTTSLGNAMYTGIYLGTDLLNEKYGAKEARRAVWVGFFIMLAFTITTQLAIMVTPHETDWAQPHLQSLFGVFPAILIVSFSAFLISQQLDVSIYHWIKKKLPAYKYLWVRNNGSTVISQLVDTAIFTFLLTDYLPWGIFPKEACVSIFVSTYIIKVLVSTLDTPFIYLMTKTKPKKWVTEEEEEAA
ncbi:MAG: queuosine precursor transporter [Bacillaceae bacterium]